MSREPTPVLPASAFRSCHPLEQAQGGIALHSGRCVSSASGRPYRNSEPLVAPMSPSDWLTCTDPTGLLNHVCGSVSERKRRLLACAAARRVWHLMGDPRSRNAIEASERYADDPRSVLDLLDAERAAGEVLSELWAALHRAIADYDDHFLDDAPDGEGSEPTADDGYYAYDAVVAATDSLHAAQIAQRAAA